MNQQFFRIPVALLSLAFAGLLFCSSGLQAQDDSRVDFANDIRPILESECLRCHGPDEEEGGFRVDERESLLDYIEAGDAENSELYNDFLATDEEEYLMPPPDDGGPLDDSDLMLVRNWIDQGAKWPASVSLRTNASQDDSENEGNDNSTGGDTDAIVGNGQTSDEQEDAPAAVAKEQGPNIWKAIGSLHPAAVHLPMGLLLAAGLFALLSLRGNFVMSDCAYYCLWLGTLGAIAGCLTGWWFVLIEFPNEQVTVIEDLKNTDHKVFWHRTSALVATVFALMLALLAASARNRDPDDGVGWKLGLILLAAAIGFVGHQGGKLTWRSSHYDELNEVIREYIPGLFADPEQGKENGEAQPDPEDENRDEIEEGSSDNDSPSDSNSSEDSADA